MSKIFQKIENEIQQRQHLGIQVKTPENTNPVYYDTPIQLFSFRKETPRLLSKVIESCRLFILIENNTPYTLCLGYDIFSSSTINKEKDALSK